MRLATYGFMGVVTISFVSGLSATAFQCPLPAPWRATNPSVCPGTKSIYLFNGVMNIVTDVQLCGLAIAMVWDVKTDVKKKSTVIGLLGYSPLAYCKIHLVVTTRFSLDITRLLFQHLFRTRAHMKFSPGAPLLPS